MGGSPTDNPGYIVKRFLLAFLVAPVLPASVQAWLIYRAGEYHPLAVFIVVAGALYVLQLVVGVPGYLFLRRTKRHRLGTYALLGFCGAAMPFLVGWLYGCPQPDCRVFQGIWLSAHAGLLSATTAAIFWFIARPGKVALPSIPASN
jgi:hypothetical protein